MKTLITATAVAAAIATNPVSASSQLMPLFDEPAPVVVTPIQPRWSDGNFQALGMPGVLYNYWIKKGERYFSFREFVKWYQSESVKIQRAHGSESPVPPTEDWIRDNNPGLINFMCVIPTTVSRDALATAAHTNHFPNRRIQGRMISGDAETACSHRAFADWTCANYRGIARVNDDFGEKYRNGYMSFSTAQQACSDRTAGLGVIQVSVRSSTSQVFIPVSLVPTGRQNAEEALSGLRFQVIRSGATVRDLLDKTVTATNVVLNGAVLRGIPDNLDTRTDAEREAQAKAQVDPTTPTQMEALAIIQRAMLERFASALPAAKSSVAFNPDQPLGEVHPEDQFDAQSGATEEPPSLTSKEVDDLKKANALLVSQIGEQKTALDNAGKANTVKDAEIQSVTAHWNAAKKDENFWRYLFGISVFVIMGLIATLMIVVIKGAAIGRLVGRWIDSLQAKIKPKQDIIDKADHYDRLNQAKKACWTGSRMKSGEVDDLDTDDIMRLFPLALEIRVRMQEDKAAGARDFSINGVCAWLTARENMARSEGQSNVPLSPQEEALLHGWNLDHFGPMNSLTIQAVLHDAMARRRADEALTDATTSISALKSKLNEVKVQLGRFDDIAIKPKGEKRKAITGIFHFDQACKAANDVMTTFEALEGRLSQPPDPPKKNGNGSQVNGTDPTVAASLADLEKLMSGPGSNGQGNGGRHSHPGPISIGGPVGQVIKTMPPPPPSNGAGNGSSTS